jgi:SAM-dependent methyltransferase
MTDIDVRAFDDFEAAGWERVADRYGELLSPITSQAIEPVAQRGPRPSGHARSRCRNRSRTHRGGCGRTGRRYDRDRHCRCDGRDRLARRHPCASFVQGSATELPFADGSFYAAVGNIVILHIGEPERAAKELARALVPGGRVALSTWDVPERSPLFSALVGAVADAEVSPPSDVPHGPPFFQFGEDEVFRALLVGAGFADVEIHSVTFASSSGSPPGLAVIATPFRLR